MNRGLYILGLVLAVVSAFSFKLFPETTSTNQVTRVTETRQGSYTTSYGEVPFGTVLIKSSVKPNEYLGGIFNQCKINSNVIPQVNELPDSIFDARRIKSGNKYAVLYEVIEGELSAKQFIYEKNKVDYLVFNLNEELEVEEQAKPIEYVERMTAGTIESSLYMTMLDNDANPLLAVELAEIYKWTIDFYRIQSNDYFKAIYVEQFVEGESIGAFDIKACVFSHFSREQYAFHYHHDAAGVHYNDYYDEEALSMKRAFLQAPVKYSRISSKYSKRRLHPVTGKNKPHLGTDYAAPTGTPIYATADGVVTHAQYKKYNGRYVKIKHDKTYTTQYLHMSKIASGIKKGTYVEQGDIIGYVGSTGLATGPHVCYRFWKNGKQVDPYKEILPKAKHIEENHVEDYMHYIEPLKERLDSTELLPS